MISRLVFLGVGYYGAVRVHNLVARPALAPVRHDLAPGSIEWVQATLNKRGIMATPMPVTGMDDLATRQAVRVFQRFHGLTVDGDAGPLTIAELEKAAG